MNRKAHNKNNRVRYTNRIDIKIILLQQNIYNIL